MMTAPSRVSEPMTDDSVQESAEPQVRLADMVPRRDETGGAVETGDTDRTDRQAALRALRSLEATEARLERNARREVDEARGKLVQDLLPVLDNLDRTIRAAHRGHGDPAMLEGVRMVRQQLEGVLRGYGVERIEAVDRRFDPGMHEAIAVTPVGDPRRHGIVLEEVESGYRFGGRLLRPAKVTVGKLVAPATVTRPSLWQ
jgi:molecular chaperone GrpE